MGSLNIQQGGGGFKALEPNRYDARLIGLVGLGLQEQKPYKGEQKAPAQKIKLIFELVGTERNDGKTEVTSKNVTTSIHEKGNFAKYLGAVAGKTFTTDSFGAFVSSDESLQGLLGKAVQIDISNFEVDGKTLAYVSGAVALDARIECKDATRKTFTFFPGNPDMDAWSEITHYTKKMIMDAIDNKSFPRELHQQFVMDQEAEVVKKQEREAGKSNKADNDDTSAIS